MAAFAATAASCASAASSAWPAATVALTATFVSWRDALPVAADLAWRRALRPAIEVGSLVNNADIFEAVLQSIYPVLVAGKQAVASVHLELALRHLLGLFNLILRELHRRRLIWLLLLLAGSLSLLVLVRRLLGVVR